MCLINMVDTIRTTENAHCNGHADDRNTKEEEVYHDLCAIQRASRPQVFFNNILDFVFILLV